MEHAQLAAFCAELLTRAQAARAALTTHPDCPADLRARLDALHARATHPEVTLLVLGPLKSGKSTLMQVLCETPQVSQVSPLPAYPCIVEIRDLPRDAAQRPRAAPSCTFYRGTQAEPPTSLSVGQARLRQLLDEYIAAEHEGAAPTYTKVVQTLDLQPRQPGLSPVLIDSPGLFFSRHDYSAQTEELEAEADVAIFVVRPEQLFFKSISDYLLALCTAPRHRQIYVLVNVNSQNEMQEGDALIRYDQPEKFAELQRYFYSHVATNALIGLLEKHQRLHFADLLLVNRAVVRADPDAQALCAAHPQLAAGVTAVRAYLQGDLAQQKQYGLQLEFAETLAHGQTWLRDLLAARAHALTLLATRQRRLSTDLATRTSEAHAAAAEAAAQAHALARQQERRARLTATPQAPHDVLFAALSPTDEDPLLQRLAVFTNAPPDAPAVRARVRTLLGDSSNALVDQFYTHWMRGGWGPRTLPVLADALWTRTLDPAQPALKEHYTTLVHELIETWRTVLAQVWTPESDPELSDALHYADCTHWTGLAENPLLPLLPAQIPPFERTRLVFFKTTAYALWGPHGTRVVAARHTEVLDAWRQQFVGHIAATWLLDEATGVFALSRLIAQARLIFTQALGRALTMLLHRAARDLTLTLAAAEARHAALTESLAQLHAAAATLAAEEAELRAQHADLQQRLAAVTDLLNA